MNRKARWSVGATALLSIVLFTGPSYARDYNYCDWVNGVLRCQSKTESEHYLTRSLCGYSDIESKCVTKSYEKVPATDASTESAGSVSIVRGGTPSKLRELSR
jgi:hypothetical protein